MNGGFEPSAFQIQNTVEYTIRGSKFRLNFLIGFGKMKPYTERYDYADVLMNSGKVRQALVEFQQCLVERPNCEFAHFKAGHCYSIIGDSEQEETHFQEAVNQKHHIKNSIPETRLAWALLKNGKNLMAAEISSAVVSKGCCPSEAYVIHATAYMRLKEYSKAIGVFENAFENGVDKTKSSYYNLGLCHFHLGNLKSAYGEAFGALMQDENYDKAQKLVAFIENKRAIELEKNGDILRALHSAQKAVGYLPDDQNLRANVTHLVARFEEEQQSDVESPNYLICLWCSQQYNRDQSSAYSKGIYCSARHEHESKQARGH